MTQMRLFKILLIVTAGLGLMSPLLFPYLSLTLQGITQGHFWLLISYLFVEPIPINSFGSLLHLAFNIFLLWTFGGALLQRGKPYLFYLLYFSAGLVAGLIGAGCMALSHSPGLLAGNSPALYAILIAWTLLNPRAKLLLFFALPFNASWLLLGLISANLLLDLSNGNWILFCSYGGACLYSYLFSLIAWRTESSLPFLEPFERFILRLFSKKKSTPHSKIYDFKSGKPILNDEEFMDAMLTRISLYGENSLTPTEKSRLQKISSKRKI